MFELQGDLFELGGVDGEDVLELPQLLVQFGRQRAQIFYNSISSQSRI